MGSHWHCSSAERRLDCKQFTLLDTVAKLYGSDIKQLLGEHSGVLVHGHSINRLAARVPLLQLVSLPLFQPFQIQAAPQTFYISTQIYTLKSSTLLTWSNFMPFFLPSCLLQAQHWLFHSPSRYCWLQLMHLCVNVVCHLQRSKEKHPPPTRPGPRSL